MRRMLQFFLQLIRIQELVDSIGHVCNIPTMLFSRWNFQKYSVKIMYDIIECVWEFQTNAMWDTH